MLAGHNGYVVQRAAAGYALRYADGCRHRAAAGPVDPDARTDTIFDLASVSKLFTSIALMQQVEAGKIDLDRTVASYIPAFARQRQGSRDRSSAAHPHVGLPGLAAAVEQLPDA